jgi:hypothetical protein
LGLVGLDYGPLYQIAATFEIEVTPVMLHKIQAIEAEKLKMIREAREGRQDK